jgi:hypothetical protein
MLLSITGALPRHLKAETLPGQGKTPPGQEPGGVSWLPYTTGENYFFA